MSSAVPINPESADVRTQTSPGRLVYIRFLRVVDYYKPMRV
jgi:hypothetical protein